MCLEPASKSTSSSNRPITTESTENQIILNTECFDLIVIAHLPHWLLEIRVPERLVGPSDWLSSPADSVAYAVKRFSQNVHLCWQQRIRQTFAPEAKVVSDRHSAAAPWLVYRRRSVRFSPGDTAGNC